MRRATAPILLALALTVASLSLAACGGSGGASHATTARIGDARVATNGRPGSPGGPVVVGEPSLRPLDGVAAPSGLSDRRGSCAGGDLELAPDNSAAVAAATLCLLNAERGARGLPPLRANRRLARAALAHSRDMVARAYFAHDSPSGIGMVERIRRAGYLARTASWTVGENIAWGTGDRGTPSSIVAAWMNSPPHRANILRRAFREIGLGIVSPAPFDEAPSGATYDTDFGARHRA